MIYLFIFTTLLFFSTTIIFLRNLIRLSESIIELEEQVEESLDIIDARYSRLAEISQMPVAFDDPVVKELLGEIVTARESLLIIANKISSFSGEETDE